MTLHAVPQSRGGLLAVEGRVRFSRGSAPGGRPATGSHLAQPLRSANNVFFLFEVASMEKAREFIGDPEAAKAGEACRGSGWRAPFRREMPGATERLSAASAAPASGELRGNRDRTNGRAPLEGGAPQRSRPPNGSRGTAHRRTPRGAARRRALPGRRPRAALPGTWDCARNGTGPPDTRPAGSSPMSSRRRRAK
jgi:hypothetical protein